MDAKLGSMHKVLNVMEANISGFTLTHEKYIPTYVPMWESILEAAND